MRHEGLLYGLAFLAILGVGALLIAPRLAPPVPESPGPWEERPPVRGDAPLAPVDPPRDPAPWPECRVRIVGERGALRGPLRPVVGATAEPLAEGGPGGPVLRLVPTDPFVEIGAAGHRWVRLPAAALGSAAEVVLPEAAPALVVRVREPDGRPAADVPLRVRPAAPGSEPRTDSGGAVVLDYLPPGRVVVDANTAERSGPVLHLVAGRDQDVRLVLDPAFEVAGAVRTAAGRALAGARVEAFGPRGSLGRAVHTDAQGAFLWRGGVATRVALRVHAPGHGEWSLEVEPPLRGPRRVDVGVLTAGIAGVRIAGRVHAPHPGVRPRVRVEPAVASLVRELYGPAFALYAPREVEVAADGSFEADDLPPDLPLRVMVRGAGEDLDALARGASGERVTLELAPPAGEALGGTLTLPDGRPAAGVALLVSREPRDGDLALPDDRVAVAGADGRFALRGFGARVAYLRAYAPGCRSLLARVVLPLAAPLALAFEPALTDAPRRLRGTVVDERGAPLGGVTLRAAGVTAVSGTDGRFVLEGVESLAPEVTLAYGYEPGTPAPDAAGFEHSESLRLQPGGDPFTVVLPRSARLRLRLTEGVTGAPLNWAHLVVRMPLGQRLLADRAVSGREGVVELAGLPPGLVEVYAFAPGLRAERVLTLVAGESRDLEELRLVPAAVAEGEVLDAGGRPVAGAHVALLGPPWQTRLAEAPQDREALLRRALCDAQGRFAIEGLAPGAPMWIVAWAPGYAPAVAQAEVRERDGRPTGWASLRLLTGVYLGLELEDAARGEPVRGAVAELEAPTGADYLQLVHRGVLGSTVGSLEDWRLASEHLLFEQRGYEGYLIGPLVPGPYDLTIECPGYAPLRRKVTLIDPEQSVMVDLLSGADRRYGLRLTRFVFTLNPES